MMIINRIRARLIPGADRDAGFALIYAALIMLIVSVLSVAVLSLIVTEAKPTQLSRKREQTLNTAEAGLDSALNLIRNSLAGDGKSGLLSALPQCASGSNFAVLTGSPDNGKSTYSTNIYYLKQANDPSALSLAQIKTLAMPCSPLVAQPAFAYFQSAAVTSTTLPGKANQTGDRTLHATYDFQTTNQTTLGGRILMFNVTGAPGFHQCYDVGANPGVGTLVTFQPCLALNSPSQSWVYEPNLTIQWTGDTSQPVTLCIQANSSMTPQLQRCAGAATARGAANYPFLAGAAGVAEQQQEWSFNDLGHLEGAAAGGDVDGQCLQPANESVPGAQPLVLSGCYDGTASNNAVEPDAEFGAGGATGTTSGLPGPTGQLTNYHETGRCLDITGANVNAVAEIDYPCKQKPNPALQTWNQVFAYTPSGNGLGTLSTNVGNSGSYYCMTALQPWIRFQPCNGTGNGTGLGSGDLLSAQQFTFTGRIAGDYADSYNVTTTALGGKLCMTVVGAPTAPYLPSSSMALAACDGTDVQKWNAPSGGADTQLTGVNEDVDH